MEFLLFSKIPFETPDPVALIECYCYQNSAYTLPKNYSHDG